MKRLGHLRQKSYPKSQQCNIFKHPVCCILFNSSSFKPDIDISFKSLDFRQFSSLPEKKRKKIMRCWKKKPINQSDSHKIVCFTKISMFYISFEGLKLPSDGKKGGKGFNALRIILNNSFQFCLIT